MIPVSIVTYLFYLILTHFHHKITRTGYYQYVCIKNVLFLFFRAEALRRKSQSRAQAAAQLNRYAQLNCYWLTSVDFAFDNPFPHFSWPS